MNISPTGLKKLMEWEGTILSTLACYAFDIKLEMITVGRTQDLIYLV